MTTTFSTVGFGDLKSKSMAELYFTTVCIFLGIAIFGFIQSEIIAAVKLSGIPKQK